MGPDETQPGSTPDRLLVPRLPHPRSRAGHPHCPRGV